MHTAYICLFFHECAVVLKNVPTPPFVFVPAFRTIQGFLYGVVSTIRVLPGNFLAEVCAAQQLQHQHSFNLTLRGNRGEWQNWPCLQWRWLSLLLCCRAAVCQFVDARKVLAQTWLELLMQVGQRVLI